MGSSSSKQDDAKKRMVKEWEEKNRKPSSLPWWIMFLCFIGLFIYSLVIVSLTQQQRDANMQQLSGVVLHWPWEDGLWQNTSLAVGYAIFWSLAIIFVSTVGFKILFMWQDSTYEKHTYEPLTDADVEKYEKLRAKTKNPSPPPSLKTPLVPPILDPAPKPYKGTGV